MPCSGPGYSSPLDAMKNGPREEILYVVCIQPNQTDDNPQKTDLLATVDVDPKSATYCQIIHRLRTGRKNDELHHSGWNVCSSCHKAKGDNCPIRDKLILPGLGSDRIFIVDTGKNPRAPEFFKVIESEEMHAFNCSAPHTTHCLASGELMISTMGDCKGNGKCEFIMIDTKTYKISGTWTRGEKRPKFNYDFWYQPHFDVMVSSEWGAPKSFRKGLIPADVVNPELYGTSLHFHSWSKRTLLQSIDLGVLGVTPLETRFLHNPMKSEGFVGCAIKSTLYHFYLKSDGTWAADQLFKIKPKRIHGTNELIEACITDILLSLDDKYLYLSNWIHGDIRQYDITDTKCPKLTGQVFLGGKLLANSSVEFSDDEEAFVQPEPLVIKGRRIYGGPQMLQLSLDGKRLYVSSSLYSPWDRQTYPEIIKHGATIIQLDVDTENGGMTINRNFLVDFGLGPDGPLLAHEMRYPGGDCTSDIWLPNE